MYQTAEDRLDAEQARLEAAVVEAATAYVRTSRDRQSSLWKRVEASEALCAAVDALAALTGTAR